MEFVRAGLSRDRSDRAVDRELSLEKPASNGSIDDDVILRMSTRNNQLATLVSFARAAPLSNHQHIVVDDDDDNQRNVYLDWRCSLCRWSVD